ncbi:hypothetical protein Droror1_Dr00000370 [Drosera rotundifolia]
MIMIRNHHFPSITKFPPSKTHLNRYTRFKSILSIHSLTHFITACSSSTQINHALSASSQISSPNIFAYNALINDFVQSCFPYRALELYMEALRVGLCPSSYTFTPVIKACGATTAVGFGRGVHCHVMRNGFASDVYVMTALVDYYGGLVRSGDARKVFDEMPGRDGFAWAMMVLVYVRDGEMGDARDLFDEMPVRNTASWNAMIDGYGRTGDLESATTLFDRMPRKDVISWTTMITAYSRNKRYREALNVFDEMIDDGMCPDEVTVAAVVASCAHLGALDLGRQIHWCILQQGFCLDVYVGSSLIDMYAKSGSIEKALLVFLKLREKNLFCWNAIIEGLAIHCYPKEAFAMFSRMLDENIRPNGVTFVSVLSACTHGGLVEEGHEMFQNMINTFFISPEIEHYGCMVDLLCKAGLIDDALELVQGMKMELNSVIWGALLSGCKRCKNLDVAELAVQKLTALEPDHCGRYTLLQNMYAQASKWEHVARIRTTIRELGLEKSCPGSSWIEMDGQVHQFSAADESHFAYGEVSALLNDLQGELKTTGFDSKIGVVL